MDEEITQTQDEENKNENQAMHDMIVKPGENVGYLEYNEMGGEKCPIKAEDIEIDYFNMRIPEIKGLESVKDLRVLLK